MWLQLYPQTVSGFSSFSCCYPRRVLLPFADDLAEVATLSRSPKVPEAGHRATTRINRHPRPYSHFDGQGLGATPPLSGNVSAQLAGLLGRLSDHPSSAQACTCRSRSMRCRGRSRSRSGSKSRPRAGGYRCGCRAGVVIRRSKVLGSGGHGKTYRGASEAS
jgi:hypothetical protein